MGGSYTMLHDFPNGPQRNPNKPGVDDRTTYSFKATGSYDAPMGIRISPVLRHQSGSNFARTVTISAPAALGLTATSATTSGTTAYVEPMDANREDNIWVVDTRFEKTLELGKPSDCAVPSTCSTSPTATRRRRSAARPASAT